MNKYLVLIGLLLAGCSEVIESDERTIRKISYSECSRIAILLKGNDSYYSDGNPRCTVKVESTIYYFYNDGAADNIAMGYWMSLNRNKLKSRNKCIQDNTKPGDTTERYLDAKSLCDKRVKIIEVEGYDYF